LVKDINKTTKEVEKQKEALEAEAKKVE